MAKINLYDILSYKAQVELNNLVNKKENAIDLLVKNFYGEKKVNSDDVSGRFQVQYFAEEPNLNCLQEDDKNGWWQNEAYEANEVNSNIFPVLETATTEEEWGKKYYSSFALKKSTGFNIKYPLDDDYVINTLPFNKQTVTDASYNEVIRAVEQNLNIKVVDGNVSGVNLYKQSKFALATVKIKNTFLKLTKRLDEVKTAFGGKLVLAKQTKGGYKYNNIEKIVKVYDCIFKPAITTQVKYAQNKYDRHINKNLQLASRLFANILMCRITYFGSPEINKKVEKCLSLQLANTLNTGSFTSDQLKLMTKLAVNATTKTCKQLGYSTEKIISIMTVNGYQYPVVPTSEEEALLLAHERDYSKYMENIKKSNLEAENEVNAENFGVVSEDLFKNIKNNLIINENSLNGVRNNNYAIETQEKYYLVADSSKPKPQLVAGATLEKLPAGKQIKRLPEGIKGYLGTTKMMVPAKPRSIVPYSATASTVKTRNSAMVKTSNKYGHLLKFLNPQYSRLPILKIENREEQSVAEQPKKIPVKTVEKIINKNVEKIFSNTVIKVTNGINSNRCTRFGGKENAKNLAQILSMALCFFKKAKIKTSKLASKNFATIYSRSSQFSSLITLRKNEIAKEMSALSETITRNIGESYKAYIDRLSKMCCKGGDVEGMTIEEYFQKYIINVASIYANGSFEDIYDKSSKNN